MFIEEKSSPQNGSAEVYMLEGRQKDRSHSVLSLRAVLFWGAVLAAAMVYASQVNYLLFHTAVELFSIIIAAMIFVIALNAPAEEVNRYFLFLGVAYGAVAGIDFLHALAYKGMNIFPGYDANLPTQLWIAARYLESGSLLAAFFLSKRSFRTSVLMFGYALVFVVLVTLIFKGVFPVCYVEGVGLTAFKKGSEYFICFMVAVALAILYRQRDLFSRDVFFLLVAAYVGTIFAELAFTFYISVYGLSNFIGHVFKVISFYFLYASIVKVNLQEPQRFLYWQLEQSKNQLAMDLEKFKQLEEALRSTRDFYEKVVNTAPALIIGLDRHGRTVFVNKYINEFLNQGKEVFKTEEDFFSLVPLRFRQQIKEWFTAAVQTNQQKSKLEFPIITGSGEEKFVSWHFDLWKGETGEVDMVIAAGVDISERKAAEEKLEILSFVDGLTGIANRRYFEQRLEEEWRRALRYQHSLAVLMCDIDY